MYGDKQLQSKVMRSPFSFLFFQFKESFSSVPFLRNCIFIAFMTETGETLNYRTMSFHSFRLSCDAGTASTSFASSLPCHSSSVFLQTLLIYKTTTMLFKTFTIRIILLFEEQIKLITFK